MCLAVTLSAITSPCVSPAAEDVTTAATTAPSNISFDQVDRSLDGASTPPPASAFADEVADAQKAPIVMDLATSHGPQINGWLAAIPVIGGLIVAIEATVALHNAQHTLQKQQALMQRLRGFGTPMLVHYAFYNGLTRIDMGNIFVIIRPDQQRTIILNSNSKKYRVQNGIIPPYDLYAAIQSNNPSTGGASGTGIGKSSISIAAADSATLDGTQVKGYTSDVTVTLSQSEGACRDGLFRAKEFVYYSSMTEPLRRIKDVTLDTLALADGCNAYVDRQTSGTEPSGQMYLYKLITVTRDVRVAQATNGAPGVAASAPSLPTAGVGWPANYYLLSQRGNIHALSAADAGLFEIPDGYQKIQ